MLREAMWVTVLVVGVLVGASVQLVTGQDAEASGEDSDPLVTSFDASTMRPDPAPDGIREFKIVAENQARDIYRGIHVPVVAFNGQFPGPTLRAIEGERVSVTFENRADRPMTLHFHGHHENQHDGVHEVVLPGADRIYELETLLPGIYVYHSHVPPAALRSNEEPTGVFIIDPKEPRSSAKEIVLLAKFEDTDGDFAGAEFYTFNGIADQYHETPIELNRSELLRIYLVNVNLETSTFHIHGTVFNATEMGVPGNPVVSTDSLQLGYAQRSMIEVRWAHSGLWMFHDHIAEHLELGMRGWFRVNP